LGSPIGKDTFLARAGARFGDKYDYTGILYKSYKTPIRIRCTLHPVKEILITPEKHLQTTGGCKFCLRERRVELLERELSLPAAADRPVPPARRGQAVGSTGMAARQMGERAESRPLS
jgi:hypothetical protein